MFGQRVAISGQLLGSPVTVESHVKDNDQIFEIKADKLKDLFVAPNTLRDDRLARFRTEDARKVEIALPAKRIPRPRA